MNIQEVLDRIKRELDSTFKEVNSWFEQPVDLLTYKPKKGGWSISQILEHIVLTNHYLLILIEKGAKKALKNMNQLDLEKALASYHFDIDGLEDIGITRSFKWMRPKHMEPQGKKQVEEVRKELEEQRMRCKNTLNQLKNGEGVQYKTSMSVNKLGKIDVYQYIYFLIKHAQRHTQQMENIRKEFISKTQADTR